MSTASELPKITGYGTNDEQTLLLKIKEFLGIQGGESINPGWFNPGNLLYLQKADPELNNELENTMKQILQDYQKYGQTGLLMHDPGFTDFMKTYFNLFTGNTDLSRNIVWMHESTPDGGNYWNIFEKFINENINMPNTFKIASESPYLNIDRINEILEFFRNTYGNKGGEYWWNEYPRSGENGKPVYGWLFKKDDEGNYKIVETKEEFNDFLDNLDSYHKQVIENFVQEILDNIRETGAPNVNPEEWQGVWFGNTSNIQEFMRYIGSFYTADMLAAQLEYMGVDPALLQESYPYEKNALSQGITEANLPPEVKKNEGGNNMVNNINYLVVTSTGRKYPDTPEGRAQLLADIKFEYGLGDTPSIQELIDKGIISTTVGIGADVTGPTSPESTSTNLIPGLGTGAGGGRMGLPPISSEENTALEALKEQYGGWLGLIKAFLTGEASLNDLSDVEKSAIVKTYNQQSVESGVYAGLGAGMVQMSTSTAAAINAATQALKEGGASPSYINAFISNVERNVGRGLPVDQAIEKAQQSAGGAFGQFLGKYLGKLRMTPVIGKLFGGTAAVGAGVGSLYYAHSAITQIPFAGFMTEEMEQTSMFAQFPVMDNPIELAQVIQTCTIPTWYKGDKYANQLAPKITWIPESIYPWSMTAQTMADYHNVTFTAKVANEVQRLQKMGAWKGFDGQPILDSEGNVTGWEINNWGAPATEEEIAAFLSSPEGTQYIKNYEGEIQKLAQENPGKLYSLYMAGYLDWYDLPGDIRLKIEDYQRRLKDWEYQQLNAFNPQDVLDLGSTLAGAVWYGQTDMEILNQAKMVGDWINTLVQKGQLSEQEATPILWELAIKLKNNDAAEGIWTVGADGTKTINWETLTDTELEKRFGSTTKLTEKPELTFGNTKSGDYLTTRNNPEMSKAEANGISELENSGALPPGTKESLGMNEAKTALERLREAGGDPNYPQNIGYDTPEGQKYLKESQEWAESLKESYKPTGEFEAKAGYEYSQDYMYSPSGTALTDAEAMMLYQLNDGTLTPEQAQAQHPDTWGNLVNKGSIRQATVKSTAAPEETGEITVDDIQKFFSELQANAGPEGVFATPEKVKGEPLYNPELLELMLKYGTPQERATALQQQQIYAKQEQKQWPKRGGFTGAHTPGEQAPMYEGKAIQTMIEGTKTGGTMEGLSVAELAEIYDAIQTYGTGGEMLMKDFSTKEAQKAAMGAIGYTYYEPTKEGYAGVWGGGKPVYRQSES
ncbi:TPA_asm: hypothetical protein vir520_00053 [Caudoviricetes sp. vir520]|nr:TPA_asm: hypothetical protein vir520_00053 [Caudoviricetes sp. vir520]